MSNVSYFFIHISCSSFLIFRALKVCCDLSKIQTKSFCPIANSEVPYIRLFERSDLGLHCLYRPVCPKTLDHHCIHFIFQSAESANQKKRQNKDLLYTIGKFLHHINMHMQFTVGRCEKNLSPGIPTRSDTNPAVQR